MTQRQTRALTTAGLATVAALALTGCAAQTTAAPSSNGSSQVAVTLTSADGRETCTLDQSEVPAGPVTFTIKNVDAPSISEVELLANQKIIGEKENLAPGLDPVSFTSTLDGGTYKIYCPGGDDEYRDFTVTGEAAAAPSGSTQDILKQGVSSYASYVSTQLGQLADGVHALDARVQAGDVEGAKAAYAAARPSYERTESAVEGFLLPGANAEDGDNTKNLDYLIDMREDNLDDAAGWHGFHAIERDLWENGSITEQTKQTSTELVSNVGVLTTDVLPSLEFKPEDLANGAAGLLEEVATGKITGEEESYSHLDLVDFSANVEGAQQAYAALRDGLQQIDGDLVTRIDSEFQSVQQTLDSYRDSGSLGGFLPYTEQLRASDSAKLTRAIQPLHDDLASLAEKVATAR